MTLEVDYKFQQATPTDILNHLNDCNSNHNPPLSSRVELSTYADKITASAYTFEAWVADSLVGLVAAYCNHKPTAYITNVSVTSEYMGQGIANNLVQMCKSFAQESKFETISLEIIHGNNPAMQLYKKLGFSPKNETPNSTIMQLDIRS